MEVLDQNMSEGILTTNYTENYIKKPFRVWRASFIIFLVFGVIGTILLIFSEYGLDRSYWDLDRDSLAFNSARRAYRESYGLVQMLVGLSYFIGALSLIITFIFNLILLFRNWKVLENANGLSASSAGQAVGLLFVPVFQVFWQYIAHWKLSVDQEKFISQAGIVSNVTPNKGLALAYCICNCVPYLGQIISVLVLGPLKEINQKNVSLDIIRQVGK